MHGGSEEENNLQNSLNHRIMIGAHHFVCTTPHMILRHHHETFELNRTTYDRVWQKRCVPEECKHKSKKPTESQYLCLGIHFRKKRI